MYCHSCTVAHELDTNLKSKFRGRKGPRNFDFKFVLLCPVHRVLTDFALTDRALFTDPACNPRVRAR